MGRNLTPHFMRATEASKSQSSPLEPHSDRRSPAVNTPVGKTRSLMSSASKKISHLGRKEIRSGTRSSLGVRISSPFNFQRLKDTDDIHPRSGECNKIQTTVLQSTQLNIAEKSCQSPLDKPLPSIPGETDAVRDHMNEESLLDAIEQPLIRSLSPHRTEVWPTLSPDSRTTSANESAVTRPHQVSLGESVIERVRKLNLNDTSELDHEALGHENTKLRSRSVSRQRRTLSTASRSYGETAEYHKALRSLSRPSSIVAASDGKGDTPTLTPKFSTKSYSAVQARSAIPRVKQNRNFELRKRLSSTPLASADLKKLKVESSPSGTLIPQDNSEEACFHGDNTIQQRRRRSQSRHRVTAQGSPYVLPRTTQGSEDDASKITIEPYITTERLSDPGSPNGVADVFEHTDRTSGPQKAPATAKSTALKGYPDRARKSSIPVRKQRSSNTSGFFGGEDDAPVPEVSQNLAINDSSPADDGDVDTDRDARRGRSSRRQSQNDDLSVASSKSGRSKSLSSKQKTIQTVKSSRQSSAANGKSTASPGSQSVAATIYGEEDGEKFKIKPLSRTAPKYGPRLKVSESASDFLLANGTIMAGESNLGGAGNRDEINSPKRNALTNKISRYSSCISECIDELKDYNFAPESLSQPMQRNEAKATARPLQTLRNTKGVQQGLLGYEAGSVPKPQQQGTSAPPVKPGTPLDESRKIGWPFNESVVVPFKSLEASDENDLTSQSQDMPETDRQSTPDSVSVEKGGKIHARFVVKDAASPKPKEYLDSSENDVQDVVYQKHPELIYPPRTSSRQALREISDDRSILKERFHQHDYHEPPAISVPPQSPAKLSDPPIKVEHKPQVAHKADSSIPAHGQSISSLVTDVSAISAGKGVIKNIKGLFQKRSQERSSIPDTYAAMHNSRPSDLRPLELGMAPVRPLNLQPRSPRVKNTGATLLERRKARQNETARQPGGYSESTTASITTFGGRAQINSKPRLQDLALGDIPLTESISRSLPVHDISEGTNVTANEDPPELVTATAMVYKILNRAQNETETPKKLDLIELSKLMVQMLHTARDAEKAKEKARQYASKAELECLKTRKEILEVTGLIGRMLESARKD